MLQRGYRIVGREDAEVWVGIKSMLARQGLYEELLLRQQAGGRQGDLGKESMEYALYVAGSEGGMTRGAVLAYAVTDDGANGYARMMSVLVSLDSLQDAARLISIVDHLQEAGFVPNHISFRERPMGFYHFRSYLDTLPDLACLAPAFGADAARKAGRVPA